MEVHIKSEELCERCAFGIDKCMEKWDEDGHQCDGCEMNRGEKGDTRCEDEIVCDDGRVWEAARYGCVCEDIADGIPCEFFRECDDG